MWNSNTLEDDIQRNILEYGMAVNTDRSIPDAKSGMKPVGKRILWDAEIEKWVSNKPHRKCARLVGDTMGRFHPHGDSSIYAALVRLSQEWVMRYPLIDFHGSNGNIMGDGPAAMRYTECRLSKLAEAGLLEGIKKNKVDFMPNFDETEEEPVTLPAIFPNLLCNPNDGIGWAMACSWAPHNLREVAAAIKSVINEEEPFIPGPDFPTGGLIINGNDAPGIVKAGRGTIRVRGKYNIEGKNIVFYEIPYGTRIEALMGEIGEACEKEAITNVVDIRNETSKNRGIRLVIEVAKAADTTMVLSQLFASTNLQTTFSYNQVALVDGKPMELTLKDAIDIYINHNIECICREAQFDLDKANKRLNIVLGLIKALEDIDNIINLIKKSESAKAAKENLIKTYGFNEEQAKAILDMKLSRLAKLEKVELEKERDTLKELIDSLTTLLNSKELQTKELVKRLDKIVDEFGDDRRTEITNIELPKTTGASKKKVEVVQKDVILIMNKSGMIKSVLKENFKVQRRGTKGAKNTEKDILGVIRTNTSDTLMLFGSSGKLYKVSAQKVPIVDNNSIGTDIRKIVNIEDNDKILVVTSLHSVSTPKNAIFITKNGMIKKTFLEEYLKSSRTGTAIKLKEGDEVANVIFQDDEDVIFVTKNGMSLRIQTKDIGAVGKTSMGQIGIKLVEGDSVVTALPVHKETDKLAVFYSNGYGKKVSLSEFTAQNRNTRGAMLFKKSENPDVEIVGIAFVSDEDELLVVGNKNSVCIAAKDISEVGKTAFGVVIIKDNRIECVTKI